MSNRRSYIDRDSRGRLVSIRSTSRPRSSSHGRKSTRELLNEAEEREQVLVAEIQSLQTRLSFAQRSEWHLENLRREHQTVVTEHYQCRNVHAQLEEQIRRVEDVLSEEEHKNERLEHKNEKLKEEMRLMKRLSGDRESYRTRYDEKVLEVELLRQRLAEKESSIRLAETRIDEKNRIILYLKTYLRNNGFRVED